MRAKWFSLFLLLPLAATASPFQNWRVPWEQTRPRDPAVAANGIVWFAGQGGHYVGRLDPSTGELSKVDLPDGTGPHNVVVGRTGDVWIAGNRVGWIGRMDPKTGDVKQFSTAEKGVDDPHTLVQADDGRIWFTAQHSNKVGVFDPEDESLKVWDVPTKRARPYGIRLDRNGQPWIVLLGTHKLATIEDGELKEIDIPREEARPRRLDIVDGDVWYVDYAKGMVGRYDPDSGKFSEWPSPSGDRAAPYGAIAAGDTFYYVETGPQPNRMIGIDTASGEFVFNEAVPDSGGAIRHMFHDTERDVIWYGMDTNFIGRFEPPAK